MDSIICSSDNRSLDSSLHHCKTAVETALVPVEEWRPSVSVTSLGTVSSASTRVKVPVKPERYALCEGDPPTDRPGDQHCQAAVSERSRRRKRQPRRRLCPSGWSPLPVQVAVQWGYLKGQFLGWRPLWPAARETPNVWVPQ